MAGLHILYFTPDPLRFDQNAFEQALTEAGARLTSPGDPRHTLDPAGGEQARVVDPRTARHLLTADLSACGVAIRDGGAD